MNAGGETWSDLEPALRDELSSVIESQPEFLLEHDGGPEGLRADVILATLYGFDDQVDAQWRIQRAEPYLLRPITRRPVMIADDEDPSPSLPVARYELQSNWAEMKLDWLAFRHALPADVKPPSGEFLVTVALLRYRRSRA